MSKGFLLILILSVFLTVNAWSSMVSIYVIETGVPEEAVIYPHSELWENAFLDVFFEAGHIVTNDTTMRLDFKPTQDILDFINVESALNSGIEYVIIAQLDFNTDIMNPAEISFFIYKLSSMEKIVEKKIQGRLQSGLPQRTQREEFDYMKSIARGLSLKLR
ncbi:MAG: hypothetical protein FWB86_01385 [Treponema sp.]|nr:hypothetical protein [Treponema sp.]MCL2250362.1 hypothetical protein [Treponema sp.]